MPSALSAFLKSVYPSLNLSGGGNLLLNFLRVPNCNLALIPMERQATMPHYGCFGRVYQQLEDILLKIGYLYPHTAGWKIPANVQSYL